MLGVMGQSYQVMGSSGTQCRDDNYQVINNELISLIFFHYNV